MLPNSPDPVPNELLQARKALELAAKAGTTGEGRGATQSNDEKRIRAALSMSSTYLKKAEAAFMKDPNGSNVVQFSRTAAQIAENARALSVGAVGDIAVRRLEDEVQKLQSELQRFESEASSSAATSSPDQAQGAALSTLSTSGSKKGITAMAGALAGKMKQLVSQPIAWFGLAGWALVILLLFRKPSV